jgi:FkbM family methyltransferase
LNGWIDYLSLPPVTVTNNSAAFVETHSTTTMTKSKIANAETESSLQKHSRLPVLPSLAMVLVLAFFSINASSRITINFETHNACNNNNNNNIALSGNDTDLADSAIPTADLVYTKEALRTLMADFVKEHVRYNNWNLGCVDQQFLAPYFKAIMDRIVWDQREKKYLIFDVGANNGDDAVSILGTFQSIQGMCKNFGSSVLLFSIEPSPKVFCEMTDLLKDKQKKEEPQNFYLLNIAVSDNTGILTFQDPGNEGGTLIGSNYSHLDPMTTQQFETYSQCLLSSEAIQSQTGVDYKRRADVPTYTMDLLMESLDGIGKTRKEYDRIFVLKIDTEGHDPKVLMGAKQLLLKKRVEFIIFETFTHALMRQAVEFLDDVGYECYITSPKILAPVHTIHWWYPNLNEKLSWWGNCVCAIKQSKSMSMLWRMYHSDDIKLANSYSLLY